MTDSIAANRLNHRYSPGDRVTVRKTGTPALPGVVVTNNPSGSYGVRIGTGRAAQIVECRPVEVSA